MADVVVVGAGPAGLATAIALALRSIDVVVIEARNLPIDKPCGEGVMPRGVLWLKRFGIFDLIDKTQASLFDGIALINDRGHRVVSTFADGQGLGCRRLALSTALHQRCLQLPRIKLVNDKIRAVQIADKQVVIEGAHARYTSRLVVGADGLHSRIRAWAGLQGREATVQRYGLRRHFAVRPWSNQVEVYFRHGIEAYVTPCGDDQTNIAFLWSKDLTHDLVDKFSFATLLAFFPELAAKINGATPLSEQRAVGPLQQRCTDIIADGIALIGDASGYYDAITGEGISIALASADALAHTVSSTKIALITRKQLSPYAARHRRIMRLYYRNAALLLWCARRPRLMSKLIQLGERMPQTFSKIIEAARQP